MQLFVPTNKVPVSIILGIKTNKPETIAIRFQDNRKPNTYFVKRRPKVNGYREFELNLPQTPVGGILTVFNEEVGNKPEGMDESFEIEKIDVAKVKDCPVWMKRDTRSFVKFAQEFSENASILSAGSASDGKGKKKPHIYRSDDAKFHIDYYDVITDRKTGQTLSTPARIGHNSGVIEVSKAHFINYTVPMRMIILLHEYAHKYMNGDINRAIDDESGADINALKIYLSLGYSPTEAHFAFLHVFKGANNESNSKRYAIIKRFIDDFTSGKLTSCSFGKNLKGNKRSKA